MQAPVEPGWYPDPADPTRERYWLGADWSGTLTRPKPDTPVGGSPGWGNFGAAPPPPAAPTVPPAIGRRQVRPFFKILGIVAVAIVAVAVIAGVAAGGNSKSGAGDASNALANQIETDGASQLQANLNQQFPGSTVTVNDASCVQTAGTQEYTCLSHYTVNAPSVGVTDQKYMVNIAATCDSNGDCQWHSTGPGTPVG